MCVFWNTLVQVGGRTFRACRTLKDSQYHSRGVESLRSKIKFQKLYIFFNFVHIHLCVFEMLWNNLSLVFSLWLDNYIDKVTKDCPKKNYSRNVCIVFGWRFGTFCLFTRQIWQWNLSYTNNMFKDQNNKNFIWFILKFQNFKSYRIALSDFVINLKPYQDTWKYPEAGIEGRSHFNQRWDQWKP